MVIRVQAIAERRREEQSEGRACARVKRRRTPFFLTLHLLDGGTKLLPLFLRRAACG